MFGLAFRRLEKFVLPGQAARPPLIERGLVAISAARHFRHELLVPPVEGRQFPPPAQRFRMAGIAFLPVHQNAPQGVKLAMLAEEVLAAEARRRKIPDSHVSGASMFR